MVKAKHRRTEKSCNSIKGVGKAGNGEKEFPSSLTLEPPGMNSAAAALACFQLSF